MTLFAYHPLKRRSITNLRNIAQEPEITMSGAKTKTPGEGMKRLSCRFFLNFADGI